MNITERVKTIIDGQREKGIAKYGKSVDDAKLSTVEWIRHAQEEAADLMVYLEKLKEEWNSAGIVGTIKALSDNRTTAQIEIELLGEVLNRLTSLQLSSIQTNGGLSFVDIIQEIENMIEETEQ